MNNQTDGQLLRDYAAHRTESAFAELVRRHLDFVHSAALRLVCDAHLAEDVAQGVFLALAQNAARLADRANLCGWLHQTARNIAAQTVRTIERRRARERESAAMNQLLCAEPPPSWEHIAPHLDAALGELDEPDRDALFFRYFKNYDLRTVGVALGVSDDAAQKRVSRAAERLRDCLARRGVTAGAGALAVVISANAVQAAPAGLGAAITAATVAGTAVSASTTIITAAKTIAMTTLQKTLVATALVAVVGAGIFEACQTARLRNQNQTLQQKQTQLTSATPVPTPAVRQFDNNQVITDNPSDHYAKQLSDLAWMSNSFVGDARNLQYALWRYAKAHNGQLPRQYSDLEPYKWTNALPLAGSHRGPATLAGTNYYDLVYNGSVNYLTNNPDLANNIAILRQSTAWPTPDGKWAKVYVTYSRKVFVVESTDNFAAWEAQHLITSAP